MTLEMFLNAVASYLIIIDPIGVSIVFNGLTTDRDRRESIKMAVKTVIISMSIIFVFGFYGEQLVSSLGISIEALRVSGGFLLFYTAFNMVTNRRPSGPEVDGLNEDISVFPMSIPLISGPGCLTLTILLFSKTADKNEVIAVSAAIIVVLFLTLVSLIFSAVTRRIVGKTGNDIIARLLGVLLAALAVQFIADGIRDIIKG